MSKKKVQEIKDYIEEIDISEILSYNMGQYSKYVIQDRALPDVRDGLLPVHRRILYGLYTEGNTYDKPYRKSARGVGTIMGKLHPHGDSSIYESMMRLSKDWIVRLPYVDPQGNNGSIDGDSPAAMRYTEVRLEKIVSEAMMDTIKKKGIVEMIPNYDGTLNEPVTLPVRFPSALVNAIDGIGIGYSVNSPSFNLQEIIDASIYLLKNKDKITDDEFMNIVKAPDFPTGAVVSGYEDIKALVLTGKGGVNVRGTYHLEEEDKKVNKIVFTEIPFGVNKTSILEDLTLMVREKEVAGVVDALDESDHEGVRISVTVQKGYDLNTVLAYIFKNTKMNSRYNANMTFIKDGTPKVMGALEVIRAFNNYRILTKTAELKYDKEKAEARIHVLEGILKAMEVIDDIIAIVRNSKGKKDAVSAIVKELDFTEVQADAIISLQLHRFSSMDTKELEKELKALEKELKRIDRALKSETVLKNWIVKELEEIKEEYGTPRRTKVLKRQETWEVDEADLVEDETVFVGVSEKGYIKRSSPRSYNTTKTVGVEKGDVLVLEEECSTKDVLFIFTSRGKYYRIPVYAIDELSWGDTGKYLGVIGDMKSDEVVLSTFVMPESDALSDKLFVGIVKDDGLVTRTCLKNFDVVRYNNSYDAVKTDKGEVVLGVFVDENKGYLGLESTDGRALAFPVTEITPKNVNINGMRGINLKEGESVANAIYSDKKSDIPYKDGKRGQVGQKSRK